MVKLNLIIILFLSIQLSNAYEFTVSRSLTRNNQISISDCKKAVIKIWKRQYQSFAPRPVFVNFMNGSATQTTKEDFSLRPHFLFGVYAHNFDADLGEKFFNIELTNDRYQQVRGPHFRMHSGHSVCRIIHAWRRNNSTIGVQWIKLDLREKGFEDVVKTKKIISKLL